MAVRKAVCIVDEPLPKLYEMVNLERLRLGWSQKQIREFALLAIGKGDPAQFEGRDWVVLTYALRRVG